MNSLQSKRTSSTLPIHYFLVLVVEEIHDHGTIYGETMSLSLFVLQRLINSENTKNELNENPKRLGICLKTYTLQAFEKQI